MNYKKAKKFLQNNIYKDYEITRALGMFDRETRDLLLKLKNNDKLKDDICDNHINEVEEIKLNLSDLNVYIKKDLYSQVKNCKKRFKIIYVLIELFDKRHINILLIDNKKKIVERFDTFDEFSKRKEKVMKVILDKLKIEYKFINPKKYIFSKNRKDCGLCVPLSYLYIYLKIYYDMELDQIIKLLSDFSDRNLFSIANWFINYLNL